MKKVPSASMIVGLVFTVIGLVFMCVGACIALTGGADLLLFLMIFGGIGLLFFIIGLPFLITSVKKMKNKKRLLESGVQTEGIIKDVVINRQITVNGRHPFKAECEVTDPVTGAVYLYSSENVMKKIDYLIGRSVTVYYDPNDPSIYYVDLESAENGMDTPQVYDFR